MNKFRRIGAMVLATVAATGMAMTATSAPAAAAPQRDQGPKAVWPFLTQNEQSAQRQSLWFKTDRTACNFKLWFDSGRGVSVSYPGNGRFTSLNRDANLWRGETDYASFWVRTGPTMQTGWRFLKAHIVYDNCRFGQNRRIEHKTQDVVLTVRNTNGRPNGGQDGRPNGGQDGRPNGGPNGGGRPNR
jgi:hypothetical protein